MDNLNAFLKPFSDARFQASQPARAANGLIARRFWERISPVGPKLGQTAQSSLKIWAGV